MAGVRPLPRFLTPSHIARLHLTFIHPSPRLSKHLLESASHSPLNHFHYTGETDTVTLAALLAYKIIKNHAYGDGNKRTAVLAANAFLGVNGMRLVEEKAERDAMSTNVEASMLGGLTLAHVKVAAGSGDENTLSKEYNSIAEAAPSLLLEAL